MKKRTRSPTTNAKRKPSPLRLDPTRTATIRRAFTAELARRFARLKGDVVRLVVDEDAFGLLPPVTNYDPSQPRDDKGRFGSGAAAVLDRAKGLVGRGKAAATAVIDAVPGGKWLRGKAAAFNAALVNRYGRRNTALIMASAQAISWGATGVGAAVGTPVYVPSLVAMAPGAALAELHYQYRKHFGGKVPALAANEYYPDLTAGEVTELAHVLLGKLTHEYERHLESLGIPPTTNAAPWVAATTPQKVKAFGEWLRAQAKGRLRSASDEELWRDYARQGFERGAGRAFDDTRRSKAVQALDRESMAAYQGSRGEFLRSAFGSPVAAEKVQLLAQRSFDDLSNVTEDMATRMTRTLADGLVQGQSPHEVARSLADDIDVTRARAETIARTEIVRAHAEGQLHALEQLGVEEVGVAVEWVVTDDGRLCPRCAAMEGVVLKIAEARGLIPLHPNCRCAFVPANVGESDKDQKDTKGSIDKAAADADLDFEVSIGRPQSVMNLLAGYERFLAANRWVTLGDDSNNPGQRVFIGPGGSLHPGGPGSPAAGKGGSGGKGAVPNAPPAPPPAAVPTPPPPTPAHTYSPADAGQRGVPTSPPPAPNEVDRRPQVLAGFAASLDKQDHLSDRQKADYKTAVARVLRDMPPQAVDDLRAGVGKVAWHPSPQKLTEAYQRESGRTVPTGNQVQGYYKPAERKLVLDGHTTAGSNTRFRPDLGDARGANVHGVYAHEMAHAIDGGGRYSNDPHWHQAFHAEIVGDRTAPGRLSEYARTSRAEGFAEFGRLLYGSAADKAAAEKAFPKCFAFFREKKLWR